MLREERSCWTPVGIAIGIRIGIVCVNIAIDIF